MAIVHHKTSNHMYGQAPLSLLVQFFSASIFDRFEGFDVENHLLHLSLSCWCSVAPTGITIAPSIPSKSELHNKMTPPSENKNSAPAPVVAQSMPDVESKPKKKICCACPDSKKARDECIVLNGEDACKELVEAHKVCLRKEGFNV